jgi:hypothetical protein
LEAALLTGLDFVIKQNAFNLFSEEPLEKELDKVERFIKGFSEGKDLPLEFRLAFYPKRDFKRRVNKRKSKI